MRGFFFARHLFFCYLLCYKVSLMRFKIIFILFLFAWMVKAQTPTRYYLTADRVFDGEIMHEGWAVIVEGEIGRAHV